MCRCHDCNGRFARFGGSLLRMSDLQRLWRRCLLTLIMAAGAGLIMVAILWFGHSQSTPSTDSGRLTAVSFQC